MQSVDDTLRMLLEHHQDALIEHGTDWVIHRSIDLRGSRPRDETRSLVAAVVEFNRDLLLGKAEGLEKRDAFIDYVTSYRASQNFSISTLLRGFLSFKMGLRQVLETQQVTSDLAMAIHERVDELYFTAIFKMSDLYIGKLTTIIEDRQRKLSERELEVARLERTLAESLLKRFLAPSVVDEIIRGERTLDQKPKSMFVTIMFADLLGFTRLTQSLPSERMAELLNQYLTAMNEVVFHHKGTIDKFMGDGVMALFGAPMPMEETQQALLSVRCAAAMHRALLEIDELSTASGLGQLSMRIGIDCGTVVVGSFGGSHRSDFTAIGMHVNRARRIESVCTPGEIYVSSDVARLLPPALIEVAGVYQLKGLFGSVRCYQIIQSRIPA